MNMGLLKRSATKAERIEEIRNGGSLANGAWLLMSPLKISEDDFFLMGCDNSCANRNHPDVPREQREDGRWFAGAADLPERCAGWNHSGTRRADGSVQIDAFYTTLPSSAYRAPPEEVEWHYHRVRELRTAGVPQEGRIAKMNEEARSRPWAKRSVDAG